MKFNFYILSLVLISYVRSQVSNTTANTTSVAENTTIPTNLTSENTTTTNSTSATTNTTITSNSTSATNTTNSTTPIITPNSTNITNLPNVTNYLCTNEQTGITIGQNTTVCIHLYPHSYRMAFQVAIDEYSVLSMGGAFNFAYQDSPLKQSFIFQVANNFTIYPTLYFDKTNNFIVPVFNVVIKVNGGNITDVVWDNDCFNCLTSDTCYSSSNVTFLNDTSILATDKNCKMSVCANTQIASFQCDPKFYVTWFGTDKNGKQMKSSNLSMSRFRQYAVGSLYNSAKSAFNTTLATLQNTWSTVVDTTNNILKGNFK